MLKGNSFDETFRPLCRMWEEKGLVNDPTGVMDAFVGWIESGKSPATCKHDCMISKGEIACEHGQPAIWSRINMMTLRDACLIVKLKKLGISGDLQYIREKYGVPISSMVEL